jgi:FMN phosphatase YigB (HAD superfamily)
MKQPDDGPTVFLLDVDNTLLDNDRIERDLRGHLEQVFGAKACARYWAIFEGLRREAGYADFLGALQRFRLEEMHDPRLLRLSSFLVDYPFAGRLFPAALDVVRHLRGQGRAVILSDGDVVFQPRKIERSGLWDAVGGQVLIYVHKELMLDEVERRHPARRYVLVDDKLRILTAIKQAWGDRVTTVFPRQGHYAHDRAALAAYPPADVTVEHIGDLLHFGLAGAGRERFRPRSLHVSRAARSGAKHGRGSESAVNSQQHHGRRGKV